jgi:hypothetical protein
MKRAVIAVLFFCFAAGIAVMLPDREIFAGQYEDVLAYSLDTKEHLWKDSFFNDWNPKKSAALWDAPVEVKEKYLPIWKKMLMKKNSLSEEYFRGHITVVDTALCTDKSLQLSGDPSANLDEWTREFFLVLYKVKIDWAEMLVRDNFAVKTKDGGTYFDEPEVEANIKDKEECWWRFLPDIAILPTAQRLQMSFEETVRRLKEASPPDSRCIRPQGFRLDRTIGEIELFGYGCMDEKANKGMEGSIGLISGKCFAQPRRCWIE